ncbi:hypothetical protein SAMN04487914_12341 [Arthrobacter sp. ok909]|uniref:DUF2971 domain-containing protein n=1 Tax=Arthrobacter sp. ok909 TaxID=1761746 RepID=UPI0008839EE2|nr:DUF2971 domain-containing protein [Arthrobacter sp. ok909]SDP65046.1 hypothetical protein SAMN04487914_12341 [Arthrobacter sp. ok909]
MEYSRSDEMQGDDDGLVWHYTNGSALQSILLKNELWASNTAFMNDIHERRLADKYLIQAREKIGDDFPAELDLYLDHIGDLHDRMRYRSDTADGTRYLLSASRCGDSLTMWRGYAGTEEVSYAIGLDRNEPLKILRPQPGEHGYYWSTGKADVSAWLDVIYEQRASELGAEQAIETILKAYMALSRDGGPQNLKKVIAAIEETTESLRNQTKHPGFVHEEEARIIVNASGDLTRYRSGRLGMIPYVALTGGCDGDANLTVVDKPNLLPIRKIRISPGPDRFYALRSLQALLGAHGYGGTYNEEFQRIEDEIEIETSHIPFR